MQLKQSSITVAAIILLTLSCWSCGDRKPEPKPPVVSKKIPVQLAPKPATKPVEAAAPSASRQTPEATPESTEAPQLAKRIYDPKVRVNPFIPLFRSEDAGASAPVSEKSKRKKRIPQTPLEKISLEQLKLVGVIRAATGNRALVEDSSGKGYIIKKGTYIGLNSGIVTQIDAGGVFIEEELENLMGALVLQNTEMKLQKPAGE